MIDFHVHTTFSDSTMTPAVAVRHAKMAGYRSVALTDHADHANMDLILRQTLPLARKYSLYAGIEVFAGVELTHVPPALIPEAVREARAMGAQLVLVHGETISDAVETGTNLAAIEGGVDILAHPGLVSDEDAAYAAERGVRFEITTRPGHALTNGHVAMAARRHGVRCVINNDAHHSRDFVNPDHRLAVALGAGLTTAEVTAAEAESRTLLGRLLREVR